MTKLRKEIRTLTPAELLGLRRAMRVLQQRTGARGFVGLAGMHGIPRRLCPHGSPLFLPWHRVYVNAFEEALRSIDANVTLPYWDWTSQASLSGGMAAAHTDAQFNDAGVTRRNYLLAGPIEDRSRLTRRFGGSDLQRLRSIAQAANLAMNRGTFLSFSQAMEAPHGSLHIWVGGVNGDMASLPRAAFDPIFWSHHANVDRRWAVWQRDNPGENPPADVMSRVLPGFPDWRVADTLNISAGRLDYTYDGLAVVPPPSRAARLQTQPFAVMAVRPEADVAVKPRVVVKIKDVCASGESFFCDVFIGDGAVPDEAQDRGFVFAGFFGIFGMNGLGEPADIGAEHEHEHGHGRGTDRHCLTQYVDVTDAVEQLGLRGRPVAVKIQATNSLGEEVETRRLPIGDLQVVLQRPAGSED